MAMNEGATGQSQNQVPFLVATVSAVVLGVASFLNWVTAEVSVPAANFSRSVSAKGTEGSDGWITLVCAVLAIVFAVVWRNGGPKALAGLTIAAGAAGLAVGLINYSSLDDTVDLPAQFTSIGGKIEASASIGLWLVLLGGLGVLVGGILMVRTRGSETAAVAAPPPAAPPAA